MKYLVIILILTGCGPRTPYVEPPLPVVDNKFCINECIDSKLQIIGGSANAGSALMGSSVAVKGGNTVLGDVISVFEKQCNNLFQGEKCCYRYSRYLHCQELHRW